MESMQHMHGVPPSCNATSSCGLCSVCDAPSAACVSDPHHACAVRAAAALALAATAMLLAAVACRYRRAISDGCATCCADDEVGTHAGTHGHRRFDLASLRGGSLRENLMRGNATRGTLLSLDSSVSCTICFESLINCILMPCAHEIACARCAQRLSHCPICRQRVETTLRAARRPDENLPAATEPPRAEHQLDAASADASLEEGEAAPPKPSTAPLPAHLCLRCGGRSANCLFLPCSHKVWCIECAAELPSVCPVCSKAITQSLQTFHKRL